MGMVADNKLLSPEDLLSLPDEKRFELIDGQLVERNMGILSSWVAGQIHYLLHGFVKEHKLGWVLPADSGYQCFADAPATVRRPDLSFIRRGRFRDDRLPSTGWAKVVPDLVVEVLSSNDLAYEVDEKIEAFLKAGVSLIWVVNPQTKTVMVYRGDGSTRLLREGDELSCEDVLPGFHCPVAEFFPSMEAASSNAG